MLSGLVLAGCIFSRLLPLLHSHPRELGVPQAGITEHAAQATATQGQCTRTPGYEVRPKKAEAARAAW